MDVLNCKLAFDKLTLTICFLEALISKCPMATLHAAIRQARSYDKFEKGEENCTSKVLMKEASLASISVQSANDATFGSSRM